MYSAEQMMKFLPPDEVTDLHIGMDVDYSLTGQAAAYELGRRLRVKKPDLRIHIHRPSTDDWEDWDFNDALRQRTKDADATRA